MIGLGEGAVSAIVVAGTLLLTLGIAGTAVVRGYQLKVHALSLGAVGPLIPLLAAPLWGNTRMILTALLLFLMLAVASAVSAHAIMRLVALERREDRGLKGAPEREAEPGGRGRSAAPRPGADVPHAGPGDDVGRVERGVHTPNRR